MAFLSEIATVYSRLDICHWNYPKKAGNHCRMRRRRGTHENTSKWRRFSPLCDNRTLFWHIELTKCRHIPLSTIVWCFKVNLKSGRPPNYTTNLNALGPVFLSWWLGLALLVMIEPKNLPEHTFLLPHKLLKIAQNGRFWLIFFSILSKSFGALGPVFLSW